MLRQKTVVVVDKIDRSLLHAHSLGRFFKITQTNVIKPPIKPDWDLVRFILTSFAKAFHFHENGLGKFRTNTTGLFYYSCCFSNMFHGKKSEKTDVFHACKGITNLRFSEFLHILITFGRSLKKTINRSTHKQLPCEHELAYSKRLTVHKKLDVLYK